MLFALVLLDVRKYVEEDDGGGGGGGTALLALPEVFGVGSPPVVIQPVVLADSRAVAVAAAV